MVDKIADDFWLESGTRLSKSQLQMLKKAMATYALAAIHDSKVAEEAFGVVKDNPGESR